MSPTDGEPHANLLKLVPWRAVPQYARDGATRGLSGLEVEDRLKRHGLLHTGQVVLAGRADAATLTDLEKLLRPGTGTLGQPFRP